jgi:hypothetical protein
LAFSTDHSFSWGIGDHGSIGSIGNEFHAAIWLECEEDREIDKIYRRSEKLLHCVFATLLLAEIRCFRSLIFVSDFLF